MRFHGFYCYNFSECPFSFTVLVKMLQKSGLFAGPISISVVNIPFQVQNQTLYSSLQIKKFKNRNIRASPVVFAAQSNFLRVIQTVWKVGKDGIEAGTNLVPAAIPRPIARISVTIAAVMVSLFLLKSFLSTAFFALAVMGLSYFTFIALNKDEGPKGGGGSTSVEDSLEEARRIMEKYK
ncbi:UNVERIFIED_CONTAM: hypothetical protein Scaly_0657000 [Sesamum calycinum]|uniref:Uncharacterized protein n=1 Tax=Sesamum calycinum TaxID=2727403 RepID=A0AAW2RU33_9LAMI